MDKSTNKYWRSLGELDQTPEFEEFLAREFPDNQEQLVDPLSRRRFMQLMGASMAFAGVAGPGCHRYEEEKVVPLTRRPAGYTPGESRYFMTSMELAGHAQPLMVASRDGRPIKIEGSPEHRASLGGTSAFAQASILHLYDPDRNTQTTKRTDGKAEKSSWANLVEAVKENRKALAGNGGEGLRVLAEASHGPTHDVMMAKFARAFPRATWHEYEPLSIANELAGTQMAFGAPMRAHHDLTTADRILALDADFLGNHPDAVRMAKEYGARRDPDASVMNRVYAVESNFSLTGAAADHRLPLRSELIVPFLLAVEAKFNGASAPASKFLEEPSIAKFVAAVAEDFRSRRGKSVVIVGPAQPPVAHAIAARFNQTLSAIGKAVRYSEDVRTIPVGDISALAKDMSEGRVKTLVILGGNPVYNAPTDIGFADALAKVETSIHLSLYDNETSEKCTWSVPRSHFLETWGDNRTWDGTTTLQQPLIAPLYESKSSIEFLALLIDGLELGAYELMTIATGVAANPALTGAFRKAIHDGFVGDTSQAVKRPIKGISVTLSERQKGGLKLGKEELEVTFIPSTATYDGRFANNAWLQETPDYLTKAVWDNYALISPATAKDLRIENDTLVKVTLDGRDLTLPAYVMPGQAPYSIGLPLGYGRTRAGVVGGHAEMGIKSIGSDTYKLRTSSSMYVAAGAKITPLGTEYTVGNVQDHWNLEPLGRKSLEDRIKHYPEKGHELSLIKEADLADYTKDNESRNFAKKHPGPPNFSMWEQHEYEGKRWGLATDLSKCIGCNSCMVACQSENNVPVVGKDQILRTREMTWLRIDRYFKGDKENPEVVGQPVMCQHCENAPCEQVCPVGATVHSDEGLNDMVYNRCVGTRYCANNCPYRVRRFNFLNFHKEMDEPRNKVRRLLFNPEVTVRSRGVMEKCTFCVQRIQKVKVKANNVRVMVGQEQSTIPDGAIITACQQACPTDAIVFGDLNDADSQVAKAHANSRSYELLGEFFNIPRNRYLARIRNLNPALKTETAKTGEKH
jgi:molybdopterin-containing oxidoreductase family iron-sulfur binding subunit